MIHRLAGFFFGRDVFVSYSYDDSRYAEALAVALQHRKFSVFLGGWGASPGEKLSRSVVRAVKMCRLMVIVATLKSVDSHAVHNEIDMASKQEIPVVPIDVGGAIDDRRRWPGTDPVAEQPGVDPSSHVIERIVNAATFVRQEVRLRRFVAAIAVVAVALIAGSWWITNRLRNQAEAAVAKQQDDEIASRRGLRELDNQRKDAIAARGFADREKQRQESIGAALQMSNDATLLAQREPSRLAEAAVRAVVAVKRLHAMGLRTLASDSAIRATAALLPDRPRREGVRVEDYRWTISVNGRFIATGHEQQNGIRVYDVDKGRWKTIRSTAAEEPDSISNDGRTILTRDAVWRDGRTMIPENARAISEDGRWSALVTGDVVAEGVTVTVRATDGSGEPRVVHCPARHGSFSVEFSPSGRFLGINGGRGGIWDWQSEAAPIWSPFEGETDIFFNRANEAVVAIVLGQALGVEIWEWRTWDDEHPAPMWSSGGVAQFKDPPFLHGSVTFADDGLSFIYISRQREVLRNEFFSGIDRTPTRLLDSDSAGRLPRMLDAGDDGRIAVAYNDGTVTVFDQDDHPIARMSHSESIKGIRMRDRRVTSVSASEIRTWSAAPVGSVVVDDMPDEPDRSVSPNGRWRTSPFASARIIIESAVDGRTVSELRPGAAAGFSEVAFADDDRLVTVADEKRIQIWRWRNGQMLQTFRADGIERIAVDPSRRYIAARLSGRAVAIWPLDGSTDAPRTSILHADLVDFGFSSSGEFLVTADMHTIRIWTHWDTQPAEIARITPAKLTLRARFSADDRYIFLEGDYHRVERVLWRDEDFLAPVCARLHPLVAPTDRALYDEACRR